jgi:Fur family transcriptional regulator, peroxide stress response regulator
LTYMKGIHKDDRKTVILAALKGKGIKLTPQRLAVIDVLINDTSHPSAGLILKKVRKKIPGISISTVYYTLALLKKEGQIKELEFYDMENRYESEMTDHVDLVCGQCGTIMNMDMQLPFDRNTIEQLTGFIAQRMRFEYYGLCSKCSQRANKQT